MTDVSDLERRAPKIIPFRPKAATAEAADPHKGGPHTGEVRSRMGGISFAQGTSLKRVENRTDKQLDKLVNRMSDLVWHLIRLPSGGSSIS